MSFPLQIARRGKGAHRIASDMVHRSKEAVGGIYKFTFSASWRRLESAGFKTIEYMRKGHVIIEHFSVHAVDKRTMRSGLA
jgi:hypothetical protein